VSTDTTEFESLDIRQSWGVIEIFYGTPEVSKPKMNPKCWNKAPHVDRSQSPEISYYGGKWV
jgi:hypothetical protein